MPRKGGKNGLDIEQIRSSVNALMACHQQYETFNGLLDALMNANDNLSDSKLADELGCEQFTVTSARQGTPEASYDFITKLVELKSNPLNIDQQNHRHILYAKAGFIEVTEESIATHNEDVLSGLKKLVYPNHPILEPKTDPAKLPQWGDVIKKLASFQLQAKTWVNIRAEAVVVNRGSVVDPVKFRDIPAVGRIANLVANEVKPHDPERLFLERALGLSAEQSKTLKDYHLDTGIKAKPTPFSQMLSAIIDDLGRGTQKRMVTLSKDPVSGESIHKTTFYRLRHGIGESPTIVTLRCLFRALDAYADKGRISPEKINQLLVLADGKYLPDDGDQLKGLAAASRFKFSATSHQVIAAIDAQNEPTKIGNLLAALSAASDISLTQDEIGEHLGVSKATWGMWERRVQVPIPTHVDAALSYFSLVMTRRSNGHDRLDIEERERVLLVARRDHIEYVSGSGIAPNKIIVGPDHTGPSAETQAEKIKQRRQPPDSSWVDFTR